MLDRVFQTTMVQMLEDPGEKIDKKSKSETLHRGCGNLGVP